MKFIIRGNGGPGHHVESGGHHTVSSKISISGRDDEAPIDLQSSGRIGKIPHRVFGLLKALSLVCLSMEGVERKVPPVDPLAASA